MKNSPKRLLLLVVSVIALALVVAPVSFAGEDDDGPTQAGEIQGPPENSPAESQGPNAPSESNGSESFQVLGATDVASKKVAATKTQDVVQAKGGVQAGFGGMATQATSSFPMTLAFAAGILLIILAAATTFTPLRLRSQK